MAEVTKAMIYELAMAMQTRIGSLEEGIREIRCEVRGLSEDIQALRSQVGAVRTGVANVREAYGAADARLPRIERRLDVPAT